MPGHTKCCACHAKSFSQNSRSDAPKCSPSQEISERTSYHLWWTCLLYCACQATCIFPDPLQMSHACHRFFGNATKPSGFARFWQGAQSLASATRKRIWTSKSAPYPSVFCTFDFEMCFAPQRRALFRHLNFQKLSEPGVICAFWLGTMLRATTAYNFSSRFSEPTFRPSGATNHWKNTVFHDFPTFSHICIFFLLTLSLLWSSLFYSSFLSDSSHLCFSSVHVVGSLTSNLNFLRLSYTTLHCIRYTTPHHTTTTTATTLH